MTTMLCDRWETCGDTQCRHRRLHDHDAVDCDRLCGRARGNPESKCIEAPDEVLVYFALTGVLHAKD